MLVDLLLVSFYMASFPKRNICTYFCKTYTHTSVAVPSEVIDGADVAVLAGLRLTHCSGAGAFTGLRTVLSHKLLIQLQRGEWRDQWIALRHTAITVPGGLLLCSICWGKCSHTGYMVHRFLHSWRSLHHTGTPPYRKWSHTLRVLPSQRRRQGKATYRRSRCCWQHRRELQRREKPHPCLTQLWTPSVHSSAGKWLFPQLLTAAQLLPPRPQFDSGLLTGCSICYIAGTAQLSTAVLSTQVKQTVTKKDTHIHNEHGYSHINDLIRCCIEQYWNRPGPHTDTHSDYSLPVGFRWQGGVAGGKWSTGVRQGSTLSYTGIVIKLSRGTAWCLKSWIGISLHLSPGDREHGSTDHQGSWIYSDMKQTTVTM